MARQVFNGGKARELREEHNLNIRELVVAIADKTRIARGEPAIADMDISDAQKVVLAKPDSWHPDTLTNVELGHTQPSLKLSHAWATALNVSRSELLMDAPESDTP